LVDGGPASAAKFDDVHYPAYSMGAAAEMLGVTPGFLRDLGEAGLLAPQRSSGGHRRYSRHQLELAARARELVDEGMSVASACRLVSMEDQLGVARRRIIQLENAARDAAHHPAADETRER
jgi:DNA-binding transcriptional MerR regulator